MLLLQRDKALKVEILSSESPVLNMDNQ